MPEEEQQHPESNLPEIPKRPGGRRRGRRGGRGRRRPAQAASISSEQVPPTEAVEHEFSESEAPPQREKFQRPRRSGSLLLQAADEVAEIIESLKHTLAQMEEVLELIETAERQKISDEHEIESLRRQLRQIQSRRPN